MLANWRLSHDLFVPVQGDDPARRRNTAVRLRAPLAMPARSSISADPQGKGHAGLTLHQRGTAARYLAEITEWQRKHGGFRRAPPRQYSIRLNNWIQRARTNHLNGLLRDEVVPARQERLRVRQQPEGRVRQGPRARRALARLFEGERGR